MSTVKISTKSLQNIVKLMIVPQNVSKFVQKSQVVQVTADADRKALRINVESACIVSEATVRGEFSGETASLFVDSIVFRNLVSTLISEYVEFNMTNDSISITDGKSKYQLEKITDVSDGEFAHPKTGEKSIEPINYEDFQYIKDHMLFTLTESGTSDKIMYQYVYIRDDGTAVAGDFFRSIFSTHNCGSVGATYLFPQSVIQALCLIPKKNSAYSGAEYITVMMNSDDTQYISEYQLKTEATVGNFNAQILLSKFDNSSDNGLAVTGADIIRVLNQSDIVSGKSDEYITITMNGSEILFKDSRIESSVSGEGNMENGCTADVNKSRLRSIVSSCTEKTIQFNPIFDEGQVVGFCISGGASYIIGTSSI